MPFITAPISVGNGTASRETEALAAEVIADARQKTAKGRDLAYLIVNVPKPGDIRTNQHPDHDTDSWPIPTKART